VAISVGSRVSWNTPQGRTRGTVIDQKTADFTFAGQHFTASEDKPKYVVESEKTGAKAAHAASALRELKDR
jgi:Hypervirulence associated proteins TUDOR domain